jgi:prepilin signal peptidase PulO-like enzyme (type II secretory pathway)
MSSMTFSLSFAQASFGVLLLSIIFFLAIVDLRRMILPDELTLLLAAIGFAQSVALGTPTTTDAALGAISATGFLFMLKTCYRRFRAVDGLGLGDVKLSAAAGIWIGWYNLPVMLLVASTSALLVVALYALKEHDITRLTRIPFGPFLGLGAVTAWLAMVIS